MNKKYEYYFTDNEHLRINGNIVNIKDACQLYPEIKDELDKFIKTNKPLIYNKGKQILESLNIDINGNFDSQFQNAFKLFKYVIKNSKYDESLMNEKNKENYNLEEMNIKEIYDCLIENRSVCTGDSTTLSFLMNLAGIKSAHASISFLENGTTHYHEVTIFNINNKNYVCDPTLVRSSLEKNIIPKINESIFAFSPEFFKKNIYKNITDSFIHKNIDFSMMKSMEQI